MAERLVGCDQALLGFGEIGVVVVAALIHGSVEVHSYRPFLYGILRGVLVPVCADGTHLTLLFIQSLDVSHRLSHHSPRLPDLS